MSAVGCQQDNGRQLPDNCLKQVELLFRTIVYQAAEPILITDNERTCRDASCSACKMLGISRDAITGRRIDDLSEPSFRPQIEALWRTFLQQGEDRGTFRLALSGGKVRELAYSAKANISPMRHVLTLSDKSSRLPQAADYALCMLDADGLVSAWYSGAERLYGYRRNEILGQSVSCLYPHSDNLSVTILEELKRTSAQGHFGNELWQIKHDGSRFWANVLTIALRGERGDLQGFARVVRDFSKHHSADARLERGGVLRLLSREHVEESTVAGVVSGEFDHITEANDAFLEIVGYSHEDVVAGRLHWPDLTPEEYTHLDEEAHEEGLRYGACTPFEKEYFRKDGTRVRVLVALAVLNLIPFRWITVAQVLTGGAPSKIARLTKGDRFDEVVGRSAALQRVLRQVETVAPTEATVLILGETGTGKELIARAVHKMSSRKDRPLVTLNCAAIPTGLLESELFGYERGAFTGALSRKIGRFEMAHGGTLFLDEVGDIPLDLQPKLLRALQEKSFERLGGTKTIPIDVRLVAATNRHLAQMMRDNLFRSDLYYRLKVFPITIPPLRNHSEDIPALAEYFTRKYAAEMGKRIDAIPPDTMQALVSWPWPGNVRELENFMERSVILSGGPTLRVPLAELQSDSQAPPRGTLADIEREYVLRVLREADGVVSKAAHQLGIPRTTLNATMRKLGISRKDL